MADYKIFVTKRFVKDIENLACGPLPSIASKLAEYVYPQLKQEPHFGKNIKRLKGWQPPTWRYRIGAWRFFYEINDVKKIVFMLTADHRGRAYS